MLFQPYQKSNMKLTPQEEYNFKNNKSCIAETYALMDSNNVCIIHSLSENDMDSDSEKYKFRFKETGIYYWYKVKHFYSLDKLIKTDKYIVVFKTKYY
jgi:hypothetical protein